MQYIEMYIKKIRARAAITALRGAAGVLFAAVLGVASLAGERAVAAEGPRVVVSIPPLHSLIAGVMAGVGEAKLLIDGAASPHAFALRPSDARALAAADAVFWIGPDLETPLPRPLASLAGKARVVTIMDEPGITVFRVRGGGAWGAAAESVGEDAAGGAGAGSGARNPHVWLDPRNARRIVAIAAATLAEIDPANATVYRANAARMERELTALEQELAAKLAPARGVPFIVYHDAYPYFEARFGLTTIGAFALSSATAPGARRIGELRARLVESGAACVFVEPQFEPAVVKAAVDGTGARIAVLDPLGAGLPVGAGMYAQLMRNLTDNLLACLSGGSR